jgi:hypothetical protein
MPRKIVNASAAAARPMCRHNGRVVVVSSGVGAVINGMRKSSGQAALKSGLKGARS